MKRLTDNTDLSLEEEFLDELSILLIHSSMVSRHSALNECSESFVVDVVRSTRRFGPSER